MMLASKHLKSSPIFVFFVNLVRCSIVVCSVLERSSPAICIPPITVPNLRKFGGMVFFPQKETLCVYNNATFVSHFFMEANTDTETLKIKMEEDIVRN
jgi:hypothetical protein